MGRKTYEQVLTVGEFPYLEKQGYVFSKNPAFDSSPHSKVVQTNVADVVASLRQAEGKNIWLVGGASLIHLFIVHALINKIVLAIHPILLGNGIPLFQKDAQTQLLDFIGCQTYSSGLVQMSYRFHKTDG